MQISSYLLKKLKQLCLLVIAPFCLCSQLAYAQAKLSETINFNQLGIEDGLSQSNVYSIIQDHLGFIWIATQEGLNRYDGKEFTVYRHDVDDKNSISESDVNLVYEDQYNQLWVGTQGEGLNLFNPDNQSFSHFYFNQSDIDTSFNDILKIVEHSNKMWIATLGGLVHFDPLTKLSKNYSLVTGNSLDYGNRVRDLIVLNERQLLLSTGRGLRLFDINSGNITKPNFSNPILNNEEVGPLLKDSNGEIWVGTRTSGLFHLDSQFKVIKQLRHFNSGQKSIRHIRNLFETKERIWIATQANGINYYDKTSQKITQYKSVYGDSTSLNNNKVLDIFKDKTGLFWLGTWNGGVNIFDLNKQTFQNYISVPFKKNSLNNRNIWSVIKDKNNQYWFGSSGGGLTRYIAKTETYKSFQHDPQDKKSLSGDNIWSIGERDDGLLWVGTYFAGLNLFNPKTNKVEQVFKAKNDSIDAALPLSVLTMLKDKQGDWWFGTNYQGVFRYDSKSKTFKNYRANATDKNSLPNGRFYAIFQDSFQRIWFGIEGGGLTLYNPATDDFTRFTHDSHKPSSISSNTILSIAEDNQGNLLLGSYRGLDRMSALGKFELFTQGLNLTSKVINSIVVGCDGNIWLATNRGVSRLNPETKKIANFGKRDGVLSQELNTTSFYQTNDCEILLGGDQGVVSFYPKQNHKDLTSHQPDLNLTKVLKYYQPMEFKKALSELNHLDISYQDKVLSFVFALMDFNNPFLHQFAYRIAKENKIENIEWINLGTQNQLDLTNLAYGKQTLQIKGHTGDGRWSNIKQLSLNVNPPFWQSLEAYIAYFLLTLLMITLYVYKQRKKLIEQKAIAEKEREITKQLQRLDILKDQFLANTSHEFRTPLNAIIGLSNVIIEQGVEDFSVTELSELINIMKDSGENLLNLVNDILDYSAINENKTRIELADIPLKPIVDSLVLEMNMLNENKAVSISSDISLNLPLLKADRQRLYQILLNLLSNSVKFTSEGVVTITAKEDKNYVMIAVTDTGIGIEKPHLDSIFNRFEQVDASNSRQYGGAGLGLTISKKLVELHNGKIEVSSIIGEGSQFRVFIPKAN